MTRSVDGSAVGLLIGARQGSLLKEHLPGWCAVANRFDAADRDSTAWLGM
jgi:hypothetical protein